MEYAAADTMHLCHQAHIPTAQLENKNKASIPQVAIL
jgi:hypothetical protein